MNTEICRVDLVVVRINFTEPGILHETQSDFIHVPKNGLS
jgi:hypothetical protein